MPDKPYNPTLSVAWKSAEMMDFGKTIEPRHFIANLDEAVAFSGRLSNALLSSAITPVLVADILNQSGDMESMVVANVREAYEAMMISLAEVRRNMDRIHDGLVQALRLHQEKIDG